VVVVVMDGILVIMQDPEDLVVVVGVLTLRVELLAYNHLHHKQLQVLPFLYMVMQEEIVLHRHHGWEVVEVELGLLDLMVLLDQVELEVHFQRLMDL
jgi:hypothetical protein